MNITYNKKQHGSKPSEQADRYYFDLPDLAALLVYEFNAVYLRVSW